MTTTNYASIRPRRGLKADMPSELPEGELVFCTDTQEIYVGRGVGLGLKPYKAFEQDIAQAGRLRIVKTPQERDELRSVENGVICFVDADNVYYKFKDGEWEVFTSGSGGGGSVIGSLTSTLDQTTVSVAINEPLVVDLFFSTPNVGAGTLHVISNGTEILNQSIAMGSNKVPVTLTKGTHKLEIYVVDRGGVFTNTILLTAHCGGLDISTTFNSEKDYAVGTFITFPYKIDTISTEPITTYFKIDEKIYETNSNQGHNIYKFPSLGAGTHKVEVYSRSGSFESNIIKFTLVMLNSGYLYVSSLFDKEQAEEGDQIIIDYRVSMKDVKDFNAEYYVDDVLYKKGKAYNGANAFPISDLKQGRRKITIKILTLDTKHSSYVDIYINIIESSYQMQKPVTDGLIAWFDAYGLTNQDSDKHLWKDKSENGHVGTLYNFNYNSNGWIDNGLKMNGSSYVKFEDIQPFKDNAETGLTIDIEFETEDVGNENARVLDCTTTQESNVGCYIDTNEALIHSSANTVKSPFAQKERTRITYVIDRLEKITKVYVNAVLCEVAFLTDKGTGNDEVLESFKHEECIYLNSLKGLSDFGDCTVYSVRVYGRPLDSKEVLQNHIADIKDKTAQKKKHDFNHKNTIPTMYFEGDVSAMTKENRVPLRIRYISTDTKLYGESFDLPKCEVQWQGTSTLQYAVKNYKIRLKDETGEKKFKRPLREGMIPEDKFTLKADYMESSHANNTGVAKIVNRYLYNEKLPPQKLNEKVVSAIDGFPIKLFINNELLGVFNFNLDKGCDDSFGLDTKKFPECVSYEVVANTDKTAGAFNKWTPERGQIAEKATELEYLQADFELRYPDEKKEGIGKDYGYMTKLKKLVDWVSDATVEEFKRDFEKHFNKEYTLKYYLLVLTFGMVDNLGKNMMLNTWDGEIWYPCFYDLDTCLALDNSGYVKFKCDIEMTDENVYNTSKSQLWTKVAKAFDQELKEMYIKMRSTTFKEANIFKVLFEEQIDQIPELLYNEDSEKKYLKHTEYIHMLHGNRREHMKKWITERLLYLDSKMGYEEHTKESITVRANKEGQVYFDIKTFSPMYIKVRWRNGNELIQKVEKGETKRFTGTLPVGTDQEIIVYGAKHIKEIGDISHMNPTSLSLANASRLTKLICTKSPKLQSLGIGGKLKNLQVLDVTDCSTLGTVSGNNGLDLSMCENLKVAKLHGTSFQNVTFNPKGGNLEEVYLPHSITALNLNKEYRLKKVVFPVYNMFTELRQMETYRDGSQITHLNIIDCPNLTLLGVDTQAHPIRYRVTLNYRRQLLDHPGYNADITPEDYNHMYSLSCFGRLEQVKIDNSLLNYKYWNINVSPNLATASFNNMPNLKGLVLTGNRTYGDSFSSDKANVESDPSFEKLSINHCPKFEDLILQSGVSYFAQAYKFKKDFVWDLSDLKITRFISCIALQNLKKIILPDTIKEFSHSYTKVFDGDNTTQYGTARLTKDMCPLETVVITRHHTDDNFKGIDLENILIKEFSLAGLTQKVDIIQNINCKAINLKPVWISEHIIEGNASVTQEMENITVDLNEYKGQSLENFCRGVDLSNFTVKLDKRLTTENMDYSWMFYKARKGVWNNLSWIKNLPPGNISRTFENADIDRLEIGHMIGTATTNLYRCFALMKNVKEIDLRGANTSNVTMWNYTFAWSTSLVRINLEGLDFTNNKAWSSAFVECSNLEQIINVSNLIQEKCVSIDNMFMNTPKLKFDFPEGKPKWNFSENSLNANGCFNKCGCDIELEGENYILDLSECGTIKGPIQYMFKGTGFTKIISNVLISTGAYNAGMFLSSPNLQEVELARGTKLTGLIEGMAQNCPKLTTFNMNDTDMSKVEGTRLLLDNSPELQHLSFGKGLTLTGLEVRNEKLTPESVLSIVENVGTAKTSGTTLILGKTNLDKLSPEQRQIAINKKWSLA